MAKQGLTEIVTVIDRSGSMATMRDEAVGGYNAFLKAQKEVPGEATWTLVLFDHEYTPTLSGVKIQDVPDLSSETFVPRGTTALLDAVGRTIDDVGKRLAVMPEQDRPEKVMLVVLTDGMENASKDYTHGRVREMIQHQEEKYGWKILFLATDIRATQYAVAAMGINAKDTKFDQNYRGLTSYAGRITTSYRTGH